MARPSAANMWAGGQAYEAYVGRWSRLVAREFLKWLSAAPDGDWLDVGCGTGELSRAILEMASPRSLVGVDLSQPYVEYVRDQLTDQRFHCEVRDARHLGLEDESRDFVVSGLVLNFVPEPQEGVRELVRVAKIGGCVAAYVWDYAGEMQMMRQFWDAACQLDSAACQLDEGVQFPICKPEPLAKLFRGAGLDNIETRAIDVPTVFRDFDDFWLPFLGGQGPAPAYVASLGAECQTALRERVRANLPMALDGSIHLVARAWAVRGTR